MCVWVKKVFHVHYLTTKWIKKKKKRLKENTKWYKNPVQIKKIISYRFNIFSVHIKHVFFYVVRTLFLKVSLPFYLPPSLFPAESCTKYVRIYRVEHFVSSFSIFCFSLPFIFLIKYALKVVFAWYAVQNRQSNFLVSCYPFFLLYCPSSSLFGCSHLKNNLKLEIFISLLSVLHLHFFFRVAIFPLLFYCLLRFM